MIRKFPNLSTFLEKEEAEAGKAWFISVTPVGYLTSLLVAPIWLLVLGNIFGRWVLAGILTAGTLIGIASLFTFFNRQRKLERDPSEQRRRTIRKAASEVRELEVQGKLHKWMDPLALQTLEVGAFHWNRIQTTLKGTQWGRRNLPAYWRDIKASVLRASTEGMGDLLLLTSNCIGPPQKDRGNDFQEVISKFANLDISSGLQGLKEVATADWTTYAHQSSQGRAVAEHGRLIVERLASLADDVESRSTEISVSSATTGGLSSLESLDEVLSNLKSVRHAEDELEERIRTR